ncbi:hypothetical protein DL96DRAFT_414053 [Flagelloscypha sp. PMI_526]|nr:hypothetical protein DL96DRAFT_414053 [Flagelloscypha sp. PMI_526]
MPRRSTRLKSQPGYETEQSDARDVLAGVDSEPSSDAEKAKDRPRKRRKTTNGSSTVNKGKRRAEPPLKTASFDPKWRHTKGRQGLLKQLVRDAPLDIIFEIFAHLGLPDLLVLTQSSKDLRGLLLNKASPGIEALWKRVREASEGLPVKPDDISEPEFASLLFGKTCMKCGKNSVCHFMYRRRLCHSCFQADAIPVLGVFSFIRTLRPEDSVDFPSYGLKCIPIYSRHPTRRFADLIYSKDDIANFLIAYYSQPQDSCATWLSEQKTAAEDKLAFAEACQVWLAELNNSRRNNLDDLRTQRYTQIVARLRDLGWGQDLDAMDTFERYEFRKLKFVKRPQALTDRMWENMRHEVVEFMEQFRTVNHQRRTRENRDARLQILSNARAQYRNSVQIDAIIPPVVYIATLPQFSDILEHNILEADFPEDAFDHLFADNFSSVCDTWLRMTHDALLSTHSNETRDPQELLLAKNELLCVDTCRESQGSTRYPNALYHCCRSPRDLSSLSEYERISFATVGIFCETSLKLQTSQVAESFIRLCGLNPDTTTYEEMMTLDPLFVCRPCSLSLCGMTPSKYVFNYPHALYHKHIHPSQEFEGDEYLYLDNDKSSSAGNEPASLSGSPWVSTICCRHCTSNLLDQRPEILEHMIQTHDIQEPVRGTDYILNHELPCVKWVGWGIQRTTTSGGVGVMDI